MTAAETTNVNGKYTLKTPRIDMTPMVDLGFLLISFFIFTTRINDPKALKYNEPAVGDPMPVKCSTTLTLLPESSNRIGWVECVNGIEAPVKYTQLDKDNGIRLLLQQRQEYLGNLTGDPRDLFVIIKPDPNCSYQTLIDVIDEMKINEVTRYTIAN